MGPHHTLLARQLKRHFGRIEDVPASIAGFVEAVDQAYRQSDDDRGLLERSLELSSQELLRANADVRAIFNAFPDLFFRLDREGRILDYRAGTETNLYLPARELVGKRIQDIPQAEVGQRLEEAIVRVRGAKLLVSIEYPLALDGRTRVYEARMLPLHDDQIIAIVRDITARKRAEEALHEREEQLRQSQKMEAIGRLAGGVAHDLNNLLTAILGYGEFVLESLGEKHPLAREVEEIHKAGTRASMLTRQLLAFSRRQILQPKVLDLNEVVTNIDRLLRRLIGEHIEVSSRLTPRLGRVRADPGQIEQVIMNLGLNARDAMPEGGRLLIETANVSPEDIASTAMGSTAVALHGPAVMLSVTDTGQGMTDDVQARMFEPFFTTKEPGKGTGLGLSTVYGIVRQSGGDIRVRSAPGKGTTVRILLPHVSAAVATPAEAPARALPRGEETVLLVEDEPIVRQLVSTTLRRGGYHVLEAGNGAEALRLCREHPGPIHVFLTDVVMPEMGGPEFVRRATPLRPEARVVFMSGYTEQASGEHWVLAPGTCFLQKPFTPDVLGSKLREVLAAPAPVAV